MIQDDIIATKKNVDNKINELNDKIKTLYELKESCDNISDILTMEKNEDGSPRKDGHGEIVYNKSNPIEKELYHKRGTVISDEARSLSLAAIKKELRDI